MDQVHFLAPFPSCANIELTNLAMCASFRSNGSAPREGFVPVKNAELFTREIGEGQPIIVIHGGPDFDHTYLLPDMDRLADSYRLIYYDQRGRGKSRGELRLEDISIEQTIEDLEGLQNYLGLETVAILGHSWGGHVAMHYALQYPDRVSHMVLMNTAPASYEDHLLVRQDRLGRMAVHAEKLNALKSSAEFRVGDPETVAEYYRIMFSTTIKRPEHLERLNLNWTQEDILRGRAIEEQLMQGLFWSEGFTILPQLNGLHTPTLIIHGDYDWIPVPCAVHIAEAIPGARLAVLSDCGHFAYVEAPDEVHKVMDDFFDSV
jgi:proline iminopeptidase